MTVRAFLARFPIAWKLIAAGALCAAPVALMLFFMVGQFNAGITITQREMEGARRLGPLRRLEKDVYRHRLLTYLRVKGDLSAEAERQETARRIDETVSALGTPELAARWRQVRAAPAESAAAHQQLSAAITRLARETADASALVLDPDLDSYSLVELAALLLPQARNTTADAILLAHQASVEKQLSERDLARFAIYADTLENSILPQVRHAVETSLREDRNFHGVSPSLQEKLPGLMSRYDTALTGFAEAMRRYSPGMNAAGAGLRADRAGAELWEATAAELGILLEKRISGLRWRRAGAVLPCLLALALAGAALTLVSMGITGPLGEIVRLASDVGGGRLQMAGERLKNDALRRMLALEGSRDETCLLVRAIAEMTASVDALLAQVGRAGAQVAGSAARIAAAVRHLEGAVTEQAASTSQVSATSNEIFTSVQELARTMAEVSAVASEAAASASGGVGSLERIEATMHSLLSAGEALAATLTTVAGNARNIDEVITAITKIANRTNLLSLNAAIEAERAGESAGGFSVLALEIRRLADQTAVAALDIEKLIQEMQAAVREGVAGVDRYTAEMRASSGAVQALSEGLGRVIANTRKLGPDFETVNQGMQMQSQGAGQIAESMGELRDAARQTRDSLAEFRTVAEQLREAVDGLQAEVGRFSAAGAS